MCIYVIYVLTHDNDLDIWMLKKKEIYVKTLKFMENKGEIKKKARSFYLTVLVI